MDAWRPFGAGHRICIGQDLAMTEAKLLTVFLGRKFDIEEAWDEWDAKQYVLFSSPLHPRPISSSSHPALTAFAIASLFLGKAGVSN